MIINDKMGEFIVHALLLSILIICLFLRQKGAENSVDPKGKKSILRRRFYQGK